MSFRTVLVPLASGRDAEIATDLACDVARRNEGMVRGLLTGMPQAPLADETGFVDPTEAELLAERYRDTGAEAVRTFHGRVQFAHIEHELRTQQGPATPTTVQQSCAADLIVAARRQGDDLHPSFRLDHGELLVGAATPVLLAAPRPTSLSRVLIAWSPTAECARAVGAALPLLRLALRVDLLRILDGPGSATVEAAYDDTLERLRRHRVAVHRAVVPADGMEIAARIRFEAGRRECGLVVMGAYGHSRLREWVLGGVTRALLHDDRAPALLLAH